MIDTLAYNLLTGLIGLNIGLSIQTSITLVELSEHRCPRESNIKRAFFSLHYIVTWTHHHLVRLPTPNGLPVIPSTLSVSVFTLLLTSISSHVSLFIGHRLPWYHPCYRIPHKVSPRIIRVDGIVQLSHSYLPARSGLSGRLICLN